MPSCMKTNLATLAFTRYLWFYVAGVNSALYDDTSNAPRRGSSGFVFTKVGLTLATSFKRLEGCLQEVELRSVDDFRRDPHAKRPIVIVYCTSAKLAASHSLCALSERSKGVDCADVHDRGYDPQPSGRFCVC